MLMIQLKKKKRGLMKSREDSFECSAKSDSSLVSAIPTTVQFCFPFSAEFFVFEDIKGPARMNDCVRGRELPEARGWGRFTSHAVFHAVHDSTDSRLRCLDAAFETVHG